MWFRSSDAGSTLESALDLQVQTRPSHKKPDAEIPRENIPGSN